MREYLKGEFHLNKDMKFLKDMKCFVSTGEDPWFKINTSDIKINILEVTANIDDGEFIEIYWKENLTSVYNAKNSIRKKINKGIVSKYLFQIPKENIKEIRIDPTNAEGCNISIESVKIYSKYEKELKVNVGCGPVDHKDGWINVDIQPFKTVDKVMDVTSEWYFKDVEFIFAEHFIEHLKLEQIINFLYHAGVSLQNNGWIRLSTPNLKWVVKKSLLSEPIDIEKTIEETLAFNRSFYGWGHSFLYTTEFLCKLLEEIGYVNIRVCEYGLSELETLSNLEQHRYTGPDSIIIVEAQKGKIKFPNEFYKKCNDEFIKHNNAKG